MSSAVVQVNDNEAASRIEATIEGQTAYAAYQLTPGAISFTHTRVPESLRDQGIGTRLVEAGLALARSRGLEVLPVCPFFRAYLRAHPDSQELLGTAGKKLLAAPD